ncbi:hypothetical protein [uncultured Negativibacillus sp.]|uniref:hypothetical protein n=1 Tax=uncultured Negativibacillus sp. TaxID=1980696 RepID=UPI0025DBF93F|nr:hypothetical protein [uncultured Negativibacillus sp.]
MKPNVKDWSRLDNAAKIFPPTSNKQDTKVFRFACQLNEWVDRDILQQAAERTLEVFPTFRSVLKHGLFWYYLEKTDLLPIVEPEYRPPCGQIYDPSSRNLLFEITCYRDRINLEVYHALTDGTGALQFLKTLVCNYLSIKYPQLRQELLSEIEYDASVSDRGEDSFLKYYDPHQKVKQTKARKSCQLKGARVPEGRLKIIEGIMPVKEVIALAKAHQTTLTVLLTSMMLIAFAQEIPLRKKKRPVILSVPVNLRNYFHSDTARNFFGVIQVGYNFSEGPGTLEDVIAHVKEEFKRELTAEQLGARMAALSKAEHNFVARAVPLVIKDVILWTADTISESYTAGSISNIGKIDLPQAAKPYVKRFDVFVSTDKLQACLCSYGEELTISFTSAFLSANVQKHFFRQLTNEGISVEIQSNKLEDDIQ